MASEITVKNWKAHASGSLLGFFSIVLPSGMVIHECRLMQKDNRHWINFPEKQFQKRDGSTGYSKLIEIPDRARSDKFRDQCLAALKAEGIISDRPEASRPEDYASAPVHRGTHANTGSSSTKQRNSYADPSPAPISTEELDKTIDF